MTGYGKSLPKDVIDHWPEVFEEIKLTALPLKYLRAVLINFKDGRIWEIRVTAATRQSGWSSFEEKLSELFKTYEERIDNVDFKLDTAKIKVDIEKSTKKFLKKRKLN